jgi:hypothetical protein
MALILFLQIGMISKKGAKYFSNKNLTQKTVLPRRSQVLRFPFPPELLWLTVHAQPEVGRLPLPEENKP